MKVAGIDYSMTCPAVTVFQFDKGDEFNYNGCQHYYYTDKKKFDIRVDNIHGRLQMVWDSPMTRFDNISHWAMGIVADCDLVGIEDYSMGSKGKVFHIAENTGILKFKLWAKNVPYITIPPSIIKKFATDKGNADKEKMQDAFIAETGKDVKATLEQTEKQWSPSGDIIDSYYIAKYAFEDLTNRN